MHAENEAPSSPLHVPAGQSSHEVDLLSENVPAWHVVQVETEVAPSALDAVPPGQATQSSSDVPPVASAYVPRGHVVHESWKDVAYVPVGQLSHEPASPAPSSEPVFPAPHVMHVELLEAPREELYVPSGHFRQSAGLLRPGISLYLHALGGGS